MRPTAKSYFSGAGGMDLGLQQSGIELIQSLELDSTCVETLKRNFSHKIVQADISTKTVLDQEKSDIMVFTFPCQKYSLAGEIHKTRKGDALFLHAFRHAALERPEMFIVENVPGMLKFRVVMEAFERLPEYYVRTICVNSRRWLPQDRKRLIMIGTRKPFDPLLPYISKRTKLKDVLEKNPEIEIPEYVRKRLQGKYRDKPIISDPEDPNACAPCCVAHYSKDKSTRLVKDKRFSEGARPYTTKEYARLQGFPDSFKFSGKDSDIYRQVGNAVSVDVARWIGNEAIRYFS